MDPVSDQFIFFSHDAYINEFIHPVTDQVNFF